MKTDTTDPIEKVTEKKKVKGTASSRIEEGCINWGGKVGHWLSNSAFLLIFLLLFYLFRESVQEGYGRKDGMVDAAVTSLFSLEILYIIPGHPMTHTSYK